MKYRENCRDPNASLLYKIKYAEDTNNKEVSAKIYIMIYFPMMELKGTLLFLTVMKLIIAMLQCLILFPFSLSIH